MALGKIRINLRDYRPQMSDQVPPGRYPVIVDHIEMSDKQTAEGADKIISWLRITDGEYKGMTLVDQLTQSKAAMFRTVNFMNAIGLDTARKDTQHDVSSFIGKRLIVDVTEREWDNGTEIRMMVNVAGYLKYDKSSLEEAPKTPAPSTTKRTSGPVSDPMFETAEPKGAAATEAPAEMPDTATLDL